MVHTPKGSAPSGMVFWQPDPAAPPAIMGFVSHSPAAGSYFGPHIFGGTPFEQAPVLDATIEIETGPGRASSRVKTGDFLFEVEMTGLGSLEHISRAPAGMTPFTQDVVEAVDEALWPLSEAWADGPESMPKLEDADTTDVPHESIPQPPAP